jgi:ABC-type lipoprotein release transport system permease subunit
MQTLKMAWRNVFRQRRRTLLTVLTMFGGFTLSAISIGWAEGTYNNIIDMFTRNRLGHVQIHGLGYLDKPSLYTTISDYRGVGSIVESTNGVEAWAPRTYSFCLSSVGEKSAGARIVGIDPKLESEATRFETKLIQGSVLSRSRKHEALLGKGLAKSLDADISDELVVVSEGADGSIANDIFRVTGIIATDNAIEDQTALYLHIRDVDELLALDGEVHEIVVIVESLHRVGRVTDSLRERLDTGELEIDPWQVFARSFYIAMKADKQGAWIMLFIITLIVATGVLNTVLMTVLERTREYGVMRALGTRPAQILRLVLSEVAMMALISIAMGSAAALAANYVMSLQGVAMPQPFSYGGVVFDRFYTEVNAQSFWVPALTVIVTALIVSLFPALRAARIRPARAMRMH